MDVVLENNDDDDNDDDYVDNDYDGPRGTGSRKTR